jgi:ribosomal protein S18 acetylase RimI-like enzyme
MVHVRDMTSEDLGAVGDLAAQLVALHHGWDTTRFFTTPDVAEGYRRFFASQLGTSGVLLLTAEVDGAVVGYLYGSAEGRDWAKLLDAHGAVHDVFVDARKRGTGTGRALMREASARFKALGLKQVVLYAASGNTRGQALFRQLGFRPTMVEMTLDL